MTREHSSTTDPRMQAAIAELKQLIVSRYPDATFTVTHEEDPDGIYLTPTVDVEDTDEVVDLFIDRLLELQIDEGLPVYVVPVRPVARVAEQLRESGQLQRRPAIGRYLQP